MLTRIAVHLALWTLKRADLSAPERSRLVAAMLARVGALPFYNIVTANPDGSYLIRGRAVDQETVRALREGARTLLRSKTRRLIKDHLAHMAVVEGVNKGDSELRILFSKAALWLEEQETNWLTLLAQGDTEIE